MNSYSTPRIAILLVSFLLSALTNARQPTRAEECAAILEGGGGSQAQILQSTPAHAQLDRINGSQTNLRVFLIEASPISLSYRLVTGTGAPIYKGNSIPQLADKMAQDSSGVGATYFSIRGLRDDKAAVVAATLGIQWERAQAKPDLRRFETTEGDDRIPSHLFDVDAKITKVHDPKEVEEGEHKGWFRVVVEFLSGGTKSIVTFYARTIELARELTGAITQVRLTGRGPEAVMAEEILSAVKRKYPAKSRIEIAKSLSVEFGKNTLVLLMQHTNTLA